MRPFARAAALLSGVILGAALLTEPVVRADGQAGSQMPTLPDGPGRALITTQCVGCHTLEVALGKRVTADEWRTTVQAMVDLGAKITNEDAAEIARYLGQHFGPGQPAAPPAAQSKQAALPDGPGRDVLTRKCFQCHPASMWTALRQDRRQWEGVVYRMVGRGALWTEEEIRAMTDYLAHIRGPR